MMRPSCITSIEGKEGGYSANLGPGTEQFSGGELQRLALAAAIVSQPEILLLDEPTSALDPIVESKVVDNLLTLSSTKLVVTHREQIARSADRVVMVQNGKIFECGPADVDRFFEELSKAK